MQARNKTLTILLSLAVLACFGCRTKQTDLSDIHLEKVGRVELIELKSDDPKPAFYASLRFVKPDDGGSEQVHLQDKPEELKKLIRVSRPKSPLGRKGKDEFKVIYADAPATESQTSEQIDVMLLFDLSGSMANKDADNRVRFDAAIEAAEVLLKNYKPGFQIAIAPFDSHDVKSEIEDALFSQNAEQAHTQIAVLREKFKKRQRPQSYYNTALYNAVSYALDQLNARKQKDPSRKYELIVLTDGDNDVKSGDDADVLKNPATLDGVVEKIRTSDIQAFAIGFGSKVNETALKKMVGHQQNNRRYFTASEADSLRQALVIAKESLSEQLRIIFLANDRTYRELGSGEMDFEVTVKAPNKTYNGIIPFACRSVSGCVPDRKLADLGIREQDKQAIQQEKQPIQKEGGSQDYVPLWMDILKLLSKLTVFSLGLAGLWLLVPRLVWPGPSLPRLPQRGVQKPSYSQSPGSKRSVPSEAPPAAPAKPRQRFEETRIHDNPGRRDNPRSQE